MDAGRLAHRVTIERPVETADGAGGADVAWERVASVWAAIQPLAAREDASADRAVARITHRIMIRHRAGIAGGMRVAHRGRRFRIFAAHDPDEQRRYLVIEAEEERT